MGNLLYIIAVVLIIVWAIGFIGYSAGGIIHILLVIALIAVILRIIQGRNILIGALAGIAAGALLGILIAPDKGTKTRKKILKKGGDSIEDLRDRFNEILITANKQLENAADASKTVHRIKNKIAL